MFSALSVSIEDLFIMQSKLLSTALKKASITLSRKICTLSIYMNTQKSEAREKIRNDTSLRRYIGYS
jgi:hypothetical protein